MFLNHGLCGSRPYVEPWNLVAETLARDGDERIEHLLDSLESAGGALSLPSVRAENERRMERRALVTRVHSSISMVEAARESERHERAAWIFQVWTTEQAMSLAQAMGKVQTLEAAGSSSGDVLSAVAELLEMLDSIAAAHVDRETWLISVLQEGGVEAGEAIAQVLEYGLEVLEALSASTPRKGRKSIRAVCERVEALLDELEAGSRTCLGTCSAGDALLISQAAAAVEAANIETPNCQSLVLGLLNAVRKASVKD